MPSKPFLKLEEEGLGRVLKIPSLKASQNEKKLVGSECIHLYHYIVSSLICFRNMTLKNWTYQHLSMKGLNITPIQYVSCTISACTDTARAKTTSTLNSGFVLFTNYMYMYVCMLLNDARNKNDPATVYITYNIMLDITLIFFHATQQHIAFVFSVQNERNKTHMHRANTIPMEISMPTFTSEVVYITWKILCNSFIHFCCIRMELLYSTGLWGMWLWDTVWWIEFGPFTELQTLNFYHMTILMQSRAVSSHAHVVSVFVSRIIQFFISK